MKALTGYLARLLVFMALMLPLTTTEALETFQKSELIGAMGYAKFTARNQEYRIAPNAVLRSNDPGRRKFSDFKVGDEIWFKGRILYGVYYVDLIAYEKPVLY